MNGKHVFYYVLVYLLLISCQKEEEQEALTFPALMEVPAGLPEIPFPEDNAFTESRWLLGKKLFFDPIMSVDSSISCASCHKPDLAFSDDQVFSPGVSQRAGVRNAPTLANVAYHPYFTREGGVPTLEMQVLVPIQEHNEFDFNIVLLADRLSADSAYARLAMEAYDRMPDPFVITRAIACFERSLISGTSSYDQYLNSGKPEVIAAAALRGEALFFSKRTNCSACHSGFNFTNYAFANNGLYEQYEDSGRFRLTGDETDRALFKVPSLRNIALTAPYMHDGSLGSLEAVVDHYQFGGAEHPNKSELMKPILLTDGEKRDLVAFLESLSDPLFYENPIFQTED